MSGHLIIITGLIYTYVFIDQFVKGNTGMGLAYLGYAFSNIGLFMAVTKMKVWLLVMMTHGGWAPIAELPTLESCNIYKDIYTRNGHEVDCGEYTRSPILFRPFEKTHDGTVSPQGGKVIRLSPKVLKQNIRNGELHLDDAGYVDCDEIKILYPKEWERATTDAQIEYLDAVKETCGAWKNNRRQTMEQLEKHELVNTIRKQEAEIYALRKRVLELEERIK